MTLKNDKDGERRRRIDHPDEGDISQAPKARRRGRETPEVGQALRSVYDRAVQEDIPPEMLDLLGKLG